MTLKPPTTACHACRRRRLRCDRSFPTCRKCEKSGEVCPGYGKLLRWTTTLTYPGSESYNSTYKDITKPTHQVAIKLQSLSDTAKHSEPPCIRYALVDPLLQDLSLSSRLYVNHFNTIVCKDLVSFDLDDGNPFRALIPLIDEHGYLGQIVLATSAIHLAVLRRSRACLEGHEVVDALAARQRAITLLRTTMARPDGLNHPLLLAAIVFFINFDLIDTGKGEWKVHMNAAGRLIKSLEKSGTFSDPTYGLLCDAIVADCLSYHILGSAIGAMDSTTAALYDRINVSSVLQRAETSSYHCCPPKLLEITLLTSRLFKIIQSTGLSQSHVATAASLMEQAASFDIKDWVHGIRNLSSQDDLKARVSIALAHQATVCLYILLAVPEVALLCEPITADGLVTEILLNLSAVHIEHILLKGTVWPTFVAGAQTDDPNARAWCASRLQSISLTNPWVCPWGYLSTAKEIMAGIWEARDQQFVEGKHLNWIHMLQSRPNNYLIV
ncbi:fungal-specific transcription factor domain-containing protein [Xylogone sp. PMI_703]|nr:fungal-specific transcription factor domain-containing protein [Xylogone sp. PMI_703]